MFFRQRRAEKKAAAENLKQDILDGFEGRLKEVVDSKAEPGEKLVRIEELIASVDLLVAETKSELMGKAKKRRLTTYLGTAGPLAVGGTAGLIAIGLPFMAPALIPGILAAALVAEESGKSKYSKSLEKSEGFFAQLRERQDGMRTAADRIIERELEQLTDSPHFEGLLERMPRIKDAFVEAAIKRKKGAEKMPKPPRGIEKK